MTELRSEWADECVHIEVETGNVETTNRRNDDFCGFLDMLTHDMSCNVLYVINELILYQNSETYHARCFQRYCPRSFSQD